MRIAVTGGSGKLGKSVVARLRDEGHEVINLDKTGTLWTGFARLDLTDYGQVIDALFGIDDLASGFDAVGGLAETDSRKTKTESPEHREA